MSVLSKGQTVLVGGIPYFLPGKPSVSIFLILQSKHIADLTRSPLLWPQEIIL
jgi:hypothetical protein